MTDRANWPIRVGGEYAPHTFSMGVEYRRVVTAIAGDEVFYDIRVNHSHGGWGKLLPGSSLSANLFRDVSRPEDTSPIPAPVEALKGIYAGVVTKAIDKDGERRVMLNVSEAAFTAMEAALALCGGAIVTPAQEQEAREIVANLPAQAFISPEYRGHQVAGLYTKEDGVGRIDLMQDGKVVRSANVPSYKIWNYYAHATDMIDAKLENEEEQP